MESFFASSWLSGEPCTPSITRGTTVNQQIGDSRPVQRNVRFRLRPNRSTNPGKVQRAKNVLQEYEAERGHQYATVTPQIRQVPPGGIDIIFAVDEGPKVKVGHIIIDGNSAFSDRIVTRAMKNLKPIGIPNSWLFENIFARTYDSTKLDEDSERIRQFYQSRGYFTAACDQSLRTCYDVYGTGIKIPLLNPKKPGKHVDVTMVVAEGDKYYLRNFSFVGMKLFRTPDLIARQVFGMDRATCSPLRSFKRGWKIFVNCTATSDTSISFLHPIRK